MSEVYETFVISGYLSGLFNIPDFWDNKYDYLQHEWGAAPKKWIDPQKESNANQLALKSGQKTFKQIAAENGRDWRDQLNDIAEVIEYAHKLGLEIGGGEIGEYKQTKEPEGDDGSANGADTSEGGAEVETETEAGGDE
jgi:capsid protein